MDGNGRWARKRHLPRQAGHVAGVNAVREVVRAACDDRAGKSDPVRLLVGKLEAAGQPKWARLMGLFRALFPQRHRRSWSTRGVRMRIIGNRSRVDDDIRKMIEDAERRTLGNSGLNLTFAFDYGGQEEIAAAARELARAAAEGRLDPETITPGTA